MGRLARFLLWLLLAALGVRLASFAWACTRESLQMDLASFYTAGSAAERGLSPYVNHVDAEPPLWDGVASFRHSRFLYPPLAAHVFRPLALLPYASAKLGWTVLGLAALAAAVALAIRLAGLREPRARVGVAALALWFLPTLALAERGQIDGFVLLAILGAVALMRRERHGWCAGALLAVATLLKPQVLYVVPFLALRRRWCTLAGFAGAGVALVALGLAVDGSAAIEGYLTREAPRIAEHGEGGTREMALPREAFRPLLAGVDPGRTVLDGQEYAPSYFRFVLNASLVQLPWLRRVGLPPPLLSLALLVLLVAVLALGQRRWGLPEGTDLLYWCTAMIGILAVSPVSWAMGAVWLLPLAPLVLREAVRPANAGRVAGVTLCAIGLLLAGAPDPYSWPALARLGQRWMDAKYIVAELCCLAGGLALWRAIARPDGTSVR